MTPVKAGGVSERLSAIENLIEGGFVLVPLPPNSKRPVEEGWNSDPSVWLTTPTAARAYLAACPNAGVGLLHSESGTLALDLDHDGAALALKAVGIDLASLLAANPYKVCGQRGEKPIYRVPAGLSLKKRALSWPDPGGKKGPGGNPAPLCIFEIRAGAVQDVMPPTTYPGTGRPYTWTGPVPTSRMDLPMCPPELLNLLDRWPTLERVMKAACPWAESDPLPTPLPRDLERLGSAASGPESVIGQFNSSRTLGEVLNGCGYTGGPHGPWLYPNSQSGNAGVKLLPELTAAGAAVVMSFHAADPLCDGKPRDAFAVWALLEHNVDTYTASAEQMREVVKAAARFLGLPEQNRGTGTSGHASTEAKKTALPIEVWGDLTALPASTQPVPTMPAKLLPAPLATWIADEARAAGLPLEMVAAPVIVGAAGLIGARLSLRNAPNAPAVPANLWGMVCAPPGSRKSHAVKVGGLPLERAEQREAERLGAQRSHLETVRDRLAAQLEALQNNLKLALKGSKSASAPSMPTDDELTAAHDALRAAEAALKPARYVVSDATIEKLGVILNDNSYGVTLLRDELTAWLKAFEKPGRESERSQWLELANGDAVLRIDRISREPLHVSPASVAVLGCIQPKPLRKLIDEQDGGGDGLLQRFQAFIWPDTFPPFDQAAQRKPVNAEARRAAYDVLDTLVDLDLVALKSTSPSGDGAPLTYTTEAQLIYDTWEIQHEAAKRDTRTSELYRSHLAKQTSTFARLALVFHALEVAVFGITAHPHTANVGPESAALAAAWCDYLATHARKLWCEGRRSDVLDAHELLRFVERGSVRDGQKVTEARAQLAQGRAGMTGERLNAALKLLEQCGAVKIITLPVGSKGGRPSLLLRLHPQALDLMDASGEKP